MQPVEGHQGAQVVIVAAGLTLSHLAAPLVHRYRAKAEAPTASLAGGMATAYVFLHLIPELDHAHELLGRNIHFVVLAGFMIFYAAEVAATRATARHAHSFGVRIVVAMLYAGLVGFTLGEQLPEGLVATSVFTAALAAHFVAVGNGLAAHFRDAYVRYRADWLLAAATLAGSALSMATQGSERTIDVFTGLLAGFMLFTIFREEIPDTTKVRFWWFLAGTLAVLASVLLTGAR